MAGKKFEDIKLVSVSKKFPEEVVSIAYNAGIRVFGENRIQEAVGKAESFANFDDIEFHFIGNIQKNKAKYMKNHFSLIHSIDSVGLVDALDKRLDHKQDVLIQVNIEDEPQKSGVHLSELDDLVNKVINSENLFLKGLMLIPPNYNNEDDIREVFKSMHTLFNSLKDKYGNGENYSFDYLSMGMSGDYELAIEEGSNMIRIGSAIFGQRPK